MNLYFKKNDCDIQYNGESIFREFHSAEAIFLMDYSKLPEEMMIAFLNIGISDHEPNPLDEIYYINKSFIKLKSVEYISDSLNLNYPSNFNFSTLQELPVNHSIYLGGVNVIQPNCSVELVIRAKKYKWCLFEDSKIRKDSWFNQLKKINLDKDFNTLEDFWNLLEIDEFQGSGDANAIHTH